MIDDNLRIAPGHQLVAPGSIRSEALQMLLDDVRSGKRSESNAMDVHQRMTELKMRLLGDRVSRGKAWRLAREHDWETLRDAEHLAITRLQADALITVDPRLAAAAAGIVEVAPLEALLSGDR